MEGYQKEEPLSASMAKSPSVLERDVLVEQLHWAACTAMSNPSPNQLISEQQYFVFGALKKG